MNSQNNVISDWGIDEDSPPSPMQYTHFQPLRYINGTYLSAHSYTNSINSNQSQLHDYKIDNNTTDSTSLGSPVIDKSQYQDFLNTDYQIDEIQMINERYNEKTLSIVARNLLQKQDKLWIKIMDQFNYSIITCDLMRIDNKLIHIKGDIEVPSKFIYNDKFMKIMNYTIELSPYNYKIISLLISSIRYLIRNNDCFLLFQITIAVLFKFISERVLTIQIYLNKMNKSMKDFLQSSFQLDNKIIGIMNLVRDNKMKLLRQEIIGQLGNVQNEREITIQDYLILKNGLSLLTISFNNTIKTLLPYVDIGVLEKYLNIYKIDFFNKEFDFIWILNNSKFNDDEDQLKKFQIGQDFSKRELQLEKLIKRYVIIRKFFICCLLSITDNSNLNDTIIYKQILETNFNIKITTKYLDMKYKLGIIIKSLILEKSIKRLNGEIQQNSDSANYIEFNFSTLENQTPNDKLITRLDKLVNNLKYNRFIGLDNAYDKNLYIELTNLVNLYQNSNLTRSISEPGANTKRYSMPHIPKQRPIKSRDNRRASNNGLSFNLLTAVVEDENLHKNQIVSFDDNYLKLGNNQKSIISEDSLNEPNSSVIIHDMSHSTMIEMDVKEQSEILSNEKLSEHDLNESNLTHDQIKLKLNSTFAKLYS